MYIYIHICVYLSGYVCICVYVYVCEGLRRRTTTCVDMRTCARIYSHVHIHVHIHVYIHVSTYVGRAHINNIKCRGSNIHERPHTLTCVYAHVWRYVRIDPHAHLRAGAVPTLIYMYTYIYACTCACAQAIIHNL